MRRLLVYTSAASAVAASLLLAPSAHAAAPCAAGYVQQGLLCVPTAAAPAPPAPPAQAAPAPVFVAPAPQQPGVLGNVLGGVLAPVDRPTGRNLEPVVPVTPVTPAAPAYPAPAPGPSGGNAVGSPGLIGPVGVGPVLPQSQCGAPLVNIVILGRHDTCRPPAVAVVPVAPVMPVYVAPPGSPPTASQSTVPQYNLPVTG